MVVSKALDSKETSCGGYTALQRLVFKGGHRLLIFGDKNIYLGGHHREHDMMSTPVGARPTSRHFTLPRSCAYSSPCPLVTCSVEGCGSHTTVI